MRKKFLAGVAVAGLLILGSATAAQAVTQSVTDTPPGVIAVDSESPSGEGTVTRAFNVTAGGLVTGVVISVDIMSSGSNSCTATKDWDKSYSDELEMVLISPALTEVPLVHTWHGQESSTYYDDDNFEIRAQVTFDDAAADMVGTVNDQLLTTGVFKPVSPLAALNGETAAGTWGLRISDRYAGAAQCYFSATLNVVTDSAESTTPPAKQPTPAVKVETAA